MDTLNRKIIVIVIGLIVLCIGIMAHSQSTEAKPEISNEQLIKQLQAQIEQLQTIIKTQETEIQRLKALCKKAGIETKPMEKELTRGGGILEFYQKYKNKYALLDGKYIFLSTFVPKDSNSDISKWAVGEYGRVGRYRGFEIFQIFGTDEMFIVYRGDAYEAYGSRKRMARFKGWSTKNLIDGERWKGNVRCEENSDEYCGADIAIVGTYGYTTTSGGTNTVLDVVPVELFRKGITLEQFKEMLKTKGDLPDDLKKLRSDILRLEEINRD